MQDIYPDITRIAHPLKPKIREANVRFHEVIFDPSQHHKPHGTDQHHQTKYDPKDDQRGDVDGFVHGLAERVVFSSGEEYECCTKLRAGHFKTFHFSTDTAHLQDFLLKKVEGLEACRVCSVQRATE